MTDVKVRTGTVRGDTCKHGVNQEEWRMQLLAMTLSPDWYRRHSWSTKTTII